MEWFRFKRKASISSTTTATPTPIDDWTVLALRQAENSSKQRPGLSRVHNLGLQQSSSPNLLNLPSQVRKDIFRLAIVAPNPIIVCAKEPELSKKPSLLQVCHAIRTEARPIFYKQNDFKVEVHEFDIKAVLPWLKMQERVGLEEVEEEVEQYNVIPASWMDADEDGQENTLFDYVHARIASDPRALHSIPPQVFQKLVKGVDRLHTSGMSAWQKEMVAYTIKHLGDACRADKAHPGIVKYYVEVVAHWSNLFDWLKLFHEDKVKPPDDEVNALRDKLDAPEDELDASTFNLAEARAEAVLGVFKLVQGAKEMGVKWKDMRYGWKGVRKMMSAVDKGWLTDVWDEPS